jgi:hypothetical protein
MIYDTFGPRNATFREVEKSHSLRFSSQECSSFSSSSHLLAPCSFLPNVSNYATAWGWWRAEARALYSYLLPLLFTSFFVRSLGERRLLGRGGRRIEGYDGPARAVRDLWVEKRWSLRLALLDEGKNLSSVLGLSTPHQRTRVKDVQGDQETKISLNRNIVAHASNLFPSTFNSHCR